MKSVTLLILAVLFCCQTSLAEVQGEGPAAPPPETPPGTEYGDHGRVALAILQIGNQPSGDEETSQGSFLRHLDQPTSVRIVAGAFQKLFTEEESRQIADFLSSPAGQEGMGIFSRWLLRGEFLKNPVPEELASSWGTFRSTAAGIKLFAEALSLYKQITVEAVKIGGALVTKAISSDIGKRAAAGILGALLKSGVRFF